VTRRANGELEVVPVAEVGLDNIIVHDVHREDPALAFALSRLSTGPTMPTPIGVFRDVERAEYGDLLNAQIDATKAKRGDGDLNALLRSNSFWTVD